MSKKTYVNIGNDHILASRKVVSKGQEVTTEERLDKAFPEKFRLVSASEKKEAVNDEGDDNTGEDVTAEFPVAVENDLVVMKNGKDYIVYEEGEAVEGGTLTSKSKVTKFLSDYTGE